MRWTYVTHGVVYLVLIIFVFLVEGNWMPEVTALAILFGIIGWVAAFAGLAGRDKLLKMLKGCYQLAPDDLKPMMEDAVLEIGFTPRVLDDNLPDK